MTRVTQPITIPEPERDVDSLWRTAQVLKEAVEVLQGIRGNRAAVIQDDLDKLLSDIDDAIADVEAAGGGGGPTTDHPHTGDVTGTTALTLESVAITGQTNVVADSNDDALIADDSDTGNLKKVNLSSITDAGNF